MAGDRSRHLAGDHNPTARGPEGQLPAQPADCVPHVTNTGAGRP